MTPLAPQRSTDYVWPHCGEIHLRANRVEELTTDRQSEVRDVNKQLPGYPKTLIDLIRPIEVRVVDETLQPTEVGQRSMAAEACRALLLCIGATVDDVGCRHHCYLPTDGGARLLEVHAHHDKQLVPVAGTMRT